MHIYDDFKKARPERSTDERHGSDPFNVVGMGLTAEDCGIVNKSRLTVNFIVAEMKTEQQIPNPNPNP